MTMEFLSLSFALNASTIIASLLALFYLWAKYKQTYWSRRGVFSPPTHWFFGHFRDVFFLRTTPQDLLAKFHHRYPEEPVIGFYVFQKPFLLLRDTEVIKQILVKDFQIFPNHYFASQQKKDKVGTTGLFSVDNPHWRYLRMKLSSAFTAVKQKKLFVLMLESAKHMERHLGDRVDDKGDGVASLEVRDVCTKYTTDVISSLSFGVGTNSFDDPEPEFYVRSRHLFNQSVWRTFIFFINFFFPSMGDYVGASMFDHHTDYFRQVFWESMNSREKSGTKRGDIIDLLVELKNEEQSNEFKFEGDQLLAQAAHFFAAGLETSAITMTFTLMELTKHPDVQAKVRREMRDKLSENVLYENIAEMSYLQQVMSETLRLHAPAPLIDRVAVADYKIPGTKITIERGTAIYTTLTGLRTDPANHPDPLKYDPERFSEERKQLIKSGTYMPFGDGLRACIGMRTGTLQIMVGLIKILSQYEVLFDASFKNEVSKRTILMAPSDGMHLYFKKSPLFERNT